MPDYSQIRPGESLTDYLMRSDPKTVLHSVDPSKPSDEPKLTGGMVNYYLVRVDHPQREEQMPYQAECEDIIRALGMDFDEGCEFKALWRGAAARKGNGKPGHNALYDAQKRVHYANRSLRALENQQPKVPSAASVIDTPMVQWGTHKKSFILPAGFTPWYGQGLPELPIDSRVKLYLRDGTTSEGSVRRLRWSHENSAWDDIIGYKAVKPVTSGVPEGYTPWFGGKCPVSDITMVDYILRNGTCNSKIAGSLVWKHHDDKHPSDIVAYRLN